MANGCTGFDFNYSILAEIAEDAIVICEDDRICYVNSNAVMLSGWTEDELIGVEINFLLPDFRQRRIGHSQLKAHHKHDDDWLATVSVKQVLDNNREFIIISLSDLARNSQYKQQHAELVVQLIGSLATELIDLLSALLINGQAGIEWLSSEPPNLLRAAKTMENLIRNSKEAAEMAERLRSLMAVPCSSKAPGGTNEIIAHTNGNRERLTHGRLESPRSSFVPKKRGHIAYQS